MPQCSADSSPRRQRPWLCSGTPTLVKPAHRPQMGYREFQPVSCLFRQLFGESGRLLKARAVDDSTMLATHQPTQPQTHCSHACTSTA